MPCEFVPTVCHVPCADGSVAICSHAKPSGFLRRGGGNGFVAIASPAIKQIQACRLCRCMLGAAWRRSKAQAPKRVGCPVCRTLSRSWCTDPCVLLVLMLVHQTRPTRVKLLCSSAQAGRAVRPLFGQKSLYAGVGGDGQQQISCTRTCSV